MSGDSSIDLVGSIVDAIHGDSHQAHGRVPSRNNAADNIRSISEWHLATKVNGVERFASAVVVVVATAAFDGVDGEEPAAVGVVDAGAHLGEGEGAGVFVVALVLAEPAVVVLAGGGVGDGVGVGADCQGGGAAGWPYGS